jgi:hypothetical protein
MRCDLRARACCVLLLLAAACGSDEEALGMAPDAFVRAAPDLAAPMLPDGGRDAGDRMGRFVFDGGEGVLCCDKTFSFPATSGGETNVRVRGDGLEEGGLVLTMQDDTWTGALCLPPELSGVYFYELEFPAEENDGGVSTEESAASFVDRRYNDAEPTTTSALWGTVNAFVPKNADCE